eukprot:5207355-Pleurochrysis_carterae.AAC.1
MPLVGGTDLNGTASGNPTDLRFKRPYRASPTELIVSSTPRNIMHCQRHLLPTDLLTLRTAIDMTYGQSLAVISQTTHHCRLRHAAVIQRRPPADLKRFRYEASAQPASRVSAFVFSRD